MGRLTGGDPSLLRRINAAVVLRTLREATDPLTLSELAGATGLSRPTVEGIVEGLVAAGLAAESAEVQKDLKRQGRPARRYRFRAEAGHLLGLEVGAHRVSAVLSDLAGHRLSSADCEVSAHAGAEERLECAVTTGMELLAQSAVAGSTLRAVGVGTPGIIRADGSIRLSMALPGWTGFPLAERLRRMYRCPVLVENDANAAVVAERWDGVAAGCSDVVMVLAGLSPGAGSLIGGRLHRGFGGAAGEIGALHLLGREAFPEHLLSTTGEPLPPLDETAVTEVFARARSGNERARQAVERFIQRLVHDVAALVLALDPELVVVGGWAAGLEELLDPLRTELARYCLLTPRVDLSHLGQAAVSVGALRLALDHVEDQLFTVDGS